MLLTHNSEYWITQVKLRAYAHCSEEPAGVKYKIGHGVDIEWVQNTANIHDEDISEFYMTWVVNNIPVCTYSGRSCGFGIWYSMFGSGLRGENYQLSVQMLNCWRLDYIFA